MQVGPNAVPALAREGYSWLRFSARDTWESLRWPGAGALARRHWRMGVDEFAASLIKPLYVRKARRFVPELSMRDLAHRSAAGVRAQAWARDGSLLDDFAVAHDDTGLTRLAGTVRDPSHLHGLVAYLASINAELISITPVTPGPSAADTRSTS